MSDLVDEMYLLGKMDGLRFPKMTTTFERVSLLCYSETYIEELLTVRDGLMRKCAGTEQPKGKVSERV